MPPSPEEKLTPAEARLYQVSGAGIGALTGLDFGPLREAESPEEGRPFPDPVLLESLGQIR